MKRVLIGLLVCSVVGLVGCQEKADKKTKSSSSATTETTVASTAPKVDNTKKIAELRENIVLAKDALAMYEEFYADDKKRLQENTIEDIQGDMEEGLKMLEQSIAETTKIIDELTLELNKLENN